LYDSEQEGKKASHVEHQNCSAELACPLTCQHLRWKENPEARNEIKERKYKKYHPAGKIRPRVFQRSTTFRSRRTFHNGSVDVGKFRSELRTPPFPSCVNVSYERSRGTAGHVHTRDMMWTMRGPEGRRDMFTRGTWCELWEVQRDGGTCSHSGHVVNYEILRGTTGHVHNRDMMWTMKGQERRRDMFTLGTWCELWKVQRDVGTCSHSGHDVNYERKVQRDDGTCSHWGHEWQKHLIYTVTILT
jgi:hypothetical protein